MIIKEFLYKLFYNPNNYVRNRNNIMLAQNTILLKSCAFKFQGREESNRVIIGENSIIGCNFIFETDSGEIEIGKNTFINSATNLISRNKIKIGHYVTIAWGCTIYDHNSHSLDYKERQNDIQRLHIDYRDGHDLCYSKDWNTVKSSPITISDNVWIGFDCVILSGVTIGEGAIVGAGSVVRNDVEPWTVVAGNPAIVIKRIKHDK